MPPHAMDYEYFIFYGRAQNFIQVQGHAPNPIVVNQFPNPIFVKYADNYSTLFRLYLVYIQIIS